MMTDLETFKAIVRAVTGVEADAKSIKAAVERVRALFQTAPAPEAPARRYIGGRDRMEKAGADRSGDDAA
jgi:hypothetical protein